MFFCIHCLTPPPPPPPTQAPLLPQKSLFYWANYVYSICHFTHEQNISPLRILILPHTTHVKLSSLWQSATFPLISSQHIPDSTLVLKRTVKSTSLVAYLECREAWVWPQAGPHRQLNIFLFACWLVACLTSQQHASVSQEQICTDNSTCCHTETEVADPTFYLTQSQYTDNGSTSPNAEPIKPGACRVATGVPIFKSLV